MRNKSKFIVAMLLSLILLMQSASLIGASVTENENPDAVQAQPATADEAVTEEDATDNTIYGDIDKNGIVNIGDVTMMQKYLAKMLPEETVVEWSADVLVDGRTNILDALTIQKYTINFIEALPVISEDSMPNEMETELFDRINEFRAEEGLEPFKFGYFIYGCAKTRAEEGDKFFSQRRPNGSSYSTIFKDFGIDVTSRYIAENIAQYYPDVDTAMIDFTEQNIYSHNILDKNYDYIAIAVYESEEHPGYYTIEQLFSSHVTNFS